MIKLIGIILLCFVAVAIIVTFDSRPSHAQTEQILAELTVLQAQLEDIGAESEQLAALFRKIDGGQTTNEQAIAGTNAAIDQALTERGLTTVNELRDYLLTLDSMYSATLEEIRLMKVNPKMRNLKKPK